MKVLIVNSNVSQGGVTVYTKNLCKILTENSCDVIVYAGHGKELASSYEVRGVLSSPRSFSLRGMLKLRKELRVQDSDYVLVQNSWAIFLAKLFFNKLNVTLVSHGWHWRGQNKIAKYFLVILENIIHLKARKYIFISESVLSDFKRHIFFSNRHEYRLIENSVPKVGTAMAGSKQVLVPMRRDASKDHKSAFILARKTYDIDFVFCGQGVTEEFWTESMGCEIPKNIALLGVISDMRDLFESSMCTMLLSHYESLPLVLIESISCGVPCVGSDVGSIPTVIDGYGMLVSKNDQIDVIQNYLNKLSVDRAFFELESKNALKAYNSRFSYSRFEQEIKEYFKR